MTKIFQSKTRMFINKCTIRFTRRRRARTRNTNATTLLIVFCLIFCYFVFSNFRCFRFLRFPLSTYLQGKHFSRTLITFVVLQALSGFFQVYLLQISRDDVAAFLADYVIFHSACVCVCIFNAFRGIIKIETIRRTHKSLTTFSKLLCAAQVLFVNAAKFSRSPPFRATHTRTHTQQTPRHTHTHGGGGFFFCCLLHQSLQHFKYFVFHSSCLASSRKFD